MASDGEFGEYRPDMKLGESESQGVMSAIVVHEFGAPGVMRLQHMPVPVAGPNQVLVRLHAVGVNPVDTYIRAGSYGALPALPYTPGMDGAGIVEVSHVAEFCAGDRVYVGRSVSGTYAQYVLCNAGQVHRLPEELTFAQGAALHVPYWTALRALVFKARSEYARSVLIHGGSGGVGLAAIQIAKALGFQVIATAGTEQGLELLRACGADHALNHHDPEMVESVRQLTGYPKGGVDIILEMLANVNLEKDLSMLAMGGEVVVIGNRGRIEINPRDLMIRESTVTGMSLLNATADQCQELARRMDLLMRRGVIRPVVREELALGQAAKALELVMQSGAGGKIVLIP